MPELGTCEPVLVVGAISALLTALGLSVASGLRAYLPLAAVFAGEVIPNGCGGDLIKLSTPVRGLLGDYNSPWALVGILAVLAGGEFVIDKVPVLDHASDLVHTVVRPLAGAAVMAGVSNPLSEWNPWAAAALGAILALSVHGAKAATRPAVTATTAGLGNPVVSVIEDIVAVVLTALSVLAPFLAIIFFVLLALLFARAAGRTLRWVFGGRSGRLASASGIPAAGRVPPTTPGTPPGGAPTWPDMP
jgi:hypothetical protein